jgi:hypothetical protein
MLKLEQPGMEIMVFNALVVLGYSEIRNADMAGTKVLQKMDMNTRN